MFLIAFCFSNSNTYELVKEISPEEGKSHHLKILIALFSHLGFRVKNWVSLIKAFYLPRDGSVFCFFLFS